VRADRTAGNRDGKPRAFLRRSSLVAAFALAVVLAGLGGSASAAITGLERVSATSPFNSSNKSVTATCPSGKRVVGAGGQLGVEEGQVVLGFVRPDAALNAVTAQGREDENGTAASWFVTAYAICAPPPPGLERVSAQSPSNSANKAVTASCPAGKRLIGTGAEIDGGGGQVAPNDVIPGSSLKGVTVQGLEDENGTGVNWRARAYAVCANPVAGLERVVATSPTNSFAKNINASCPPGKQMTGVGAELGGGGGDVVLNRLEPSPALSTMIVTGFEDEDGTSANWFARAFAICAAASERIVAASPNDSANKSVGAVCPAGKQVTGGGGDITGGGGQVLIDDLVPSATGVGVTGLEDETGTSSSWLLRAYAICATPLPGLEVVSNESPFDSSPKNITATCPSGKRVVGAGGDITGGVGQAVLNNLLPNPALTSTTASAFEDENGYANNWSVSAHAICANPPPGLELVTAVSDPDSDPGSVAATCPSGKNLIGTGALITSGLGQVVLDDVRPDAALTRVTVTAFEDENGTASNWTVAANAICANP
jgi:hypothetical protein